MVTVENYSGDGFFIAGNNLSPQKAMILLSLSLTITRDRVGIQKIFDEH
jgi:L-asparaginase/Glu-tRNA(Gln) amidotransferase subunit D